MEHFVQLVDQVLVVPLATGCFPVMVFEEVVQLSQQKVCGVPACRSVATSL